MTYGLEAVIPVEVGMMRVYNFNFESNNDTLMLNLDLLKIQRYQTHARQAIYKQKMAKYYNEKVKLGQFQHGDLILRLNEISRA